MKYLKTGLSTIAVGALALTLGIGGESKAAGNYYYDGMTYNNSNSAYQKAKTINNSQLKIKRYDYANKTKYKAVGRVSNYDGWKGKGRDSMGTGFMIHKHTFLTNSHVVDNANGNTSKAKSIKFDLNRDGKHKAKRFDVTKVDKVPYADVAIVHTKQDMSKYAKPLKFASEWRIDHLKQGQNLYSLGYPWQNGDNTYAFWNKLKYLQKSSNNTEILTKDKFRAGASGSPMVDGKYRVYGLRTYGYNIWNNGNTKFAKQEVSGGEALTGYTRKYIEKRLY